MSVQRWAEGFRGGGVLATDGEWVKYADHVAAMAVEAESAHDLGVIYGINHERARIKAAVEAMPRTGGWTTPDGVIHEVDVARVLAIIEGSPDE